MSVLLILQLVIFAWGSVYAVGIVYFAWPGRRVRVLRRARLHEEVCVACEYGMMDIAASEDGCVVCPECGAAWRKEAMSAS